MKKTNQNLEKIDQNLGKIDQNFEKSPSKGPKNIKILTLKESVFDFRLGHPRHLAKLVPRGFHSNSLIWRDLVTK